MEIISHRGYWFKNSEKNSDLAFRRSFSLSFGTETDIRDFDGELVISHDVANKNCNTIEKFVEASENNHPTVSLWGSGSPKREFTYVDYFSLAVMFCIENRLDESMYNIGNGEEVSIKELAIIIKDVVGFKGELIWDKSKPDGIPRKLMDSSNFKSYGWNSTISLKDGIKTTLEWYLKNKT